MSTNHSSRISFTRILTVLGLAIAVFCVGMAGSATAAKLITGKDIKNNTVTTQDIKNGSLTGKDIKNGKLAEGKLSADVKNKLNAATLPGYEVVSDTSVVTVATVDTAYVHCTEGKVAVGGGGEFDSPDSGKYIVGSGPREYLEPSALYAPATADHADGWAVTANNDTINPENVTAWVICVDPS